MPRWNELARCSLRRRAPRLLFAMILGSAGCAPAAPRDSSIVEIPSAHPSSTPVPSTRPAMGMPTTTASAVAPPVELRSRDADRDGIPDDVDLCPTQPEDLNGREDQDGCPDPLPQGRHGDVDGDGIADASDACPDVREDPDGFQDADGCPDIDNDKDGIPDAVDQCPDTPETRNGVADADGCPDTR
ncbi:MAG: thrombospondin type 3 repeat-containing protein [Polyangiaceae bacterium]